MTHAEEILENDEMEETIYEEGGAIKNPYSGSYKKANDIGDKYSGSNIPDTRGISNISVHRSREDPDSDRSHILAKVGEHAVHIETGPGGNEFKSTGKIPGHLMKSLDKHLTKHGYPDSVESDPDYEKPSGRKYYNTEETIAAQSIKPKGKAAAINVITQLVSGMSIEDLNGFVATMQQYSAGKEYGVGDNSMKNKSTIAMKPSAASSMKEDFEAIFQGEELSEEFKENVSTLFEAAVNMRIVNETARLEEEYESKIQEELEVFSEEMTSKIDSYLSYVVENWMKENEVAIESTLRNELMEEFIEGLKELFAEHYISVPQEKVDVLEALADKVSVLETKLDETIEENVNLKSALLKEAARDIFEELSADLALTQQEKFSSLAESIEFDGDLETFGKKLSIIKETYFKNEQSYSSNIEEETFEGEVEAQNKNVDPMVNRYVQAIAKSIKK